MASITRSIAIMPCGPPKPRNAVFDTVLVLMRRVTNPEFGQEIGVVGMEHGAVDHAEAQIGRTSAAGVKLEVDARGCGRRLRSRRA